MNKIFSFLFVALTTAVWFLNADGLPYDTTKVWPQTEQFDPFGDMPDGSMKLPTWQNFQIIFRNMCHNYSMIVPDNLCDNLTRVFVFIPTRPDSFQRRINIRKTWADRSLVDSLNMTVRFVVGLSRDPLVSKLVFSELQTNGDLILNNIPDTYENLFLKVYSGFHWQQSFCKNATFILKTDDDTMVNLPRLNYWIGQEFLPMIRKYPRSVFGTSILKNRPIRVPEHRWYVPYEAFHNYTFPNYVTGATYLLSNAAVSGIVNSSKKFNVFTIEDALFTGVLADAAGVRKFDASNFFRGGINRTEIFEYEKCDRRQEPFVLSLYGFMEQDFFDRFKSIRNAKCLPAKFFNATELRPFQEI